MYFNESNDVINTVHEKFQFLWKFTEYQAHTDLLKTSSWRLKNITTSYDQTRRRLEEDV